MSTLEKKIIISTRPLSKDDSIKNYLTEKGATVLNFPMIEICPAYPNDSIKKTVQKINSYQWIVFTSKNGVKYFFKLLNSLNIHPEKISKSKIAVIGKKTSEEVLKNKYKPHLISSGNTSEELLKELSDKIKMNEKVLLALGYLAKNTLEKGLSEIADITRINVYKTIEPKIISKNIIERIKKDQYDFILFTSPSTFENFSSYFTKNELQKMKIASIGTTTSSHITNLGYKPMVTAGKSNVEGMCDAFSDYYKHN